MEKHNRYTQPIKSFLNDLNGFQGKCLIFLDTETTGLKGPKVEQLTQIAAIAVHMMNGEFVMFSSYNHKIELTSKTWDRIEKEPDSDWNVKNVLKFNHYLEWDRKYIPESKAITSLLKWIDKVKGDKEILMVIQNVWFDKTMIEGRSNKKLDFEMLDTKHVAQFQLLPLFQTLAETDNKYKTILSRIGTSKSNRDNGLLSSSLSNIANGLGVNADNPHDALSDCLVLMDVLYEAYNLLVTNSNVNIEKYQQICLATKK